METAATRMVKINLDAGFNMYKGIASTGVVVRDQEGSMSTRSEASFGMDSASYNSGIGLSRVDYSGEGTDWGYITLGRVDTRHQGGKSSTTGV
jgi:hypothetical protein